LFVSPLTTILRTAAATAQRFRPARIQGSHALRRQHTGNKRGVVIGGVPPPLL
jgi:hypothetical protein